MSHYRTIQALGTPVVLHSNLTKFLGSMTASALLSYLMYWSDKTNNPLGVYKTAEDIQLDTGMSKKEQMTARKKLVELGLIIETHKRLEHKLYFKFNAEVFDEWFELNLANAQNETPPSSPSHHHEVPKGNFVECQKVTSFEVPKGNSDIQRLPKNTTKITAKSNTHEKSFLTADDLIELGVDKQIAKDFIATRKTKLTQTALNGIVKQAQKANITLVQAIEFACEMGWQSFKAQWYFNQNSGATHATRQSNSVTEYARKLQQQRDEYFAQQAKQRTHQSDFVDVF